MNRTAALLLLLAPLAARAGHGRLTLELAAAGGWVSDLFVGAGSGPDAVVSVEPAARLDLSFSPELKASTRLAGTFGAYSAAGLTTGGGGGELELRWLGQGQAATLAAGAAWTGYSTGTPLDLSVLSSPSVTESRAVRVAPTWLWRPGDFEWRAGLEGAWVVSGATGGGTVTERDGALLLGGARRLGPLEAAATWRLLRASATRPDFTFTSNALLLAVGHRVGPVLLQERLDLQASRYASGVRARLLRVVVVASLELSRVLVVEATYAFAGSLSSDPGQPSAGRHLLMLGVRARAEAVAW